MKIPKGSYLAIVAIALTGIIIGADIIHNLSSGIGANGTIEADKAVADVGEDIVFSIVDNGVGSSATTRFIINFHDGTPPLEMNNRFFTTHSFPFEGLYTVTMIAISPVGLTSMSSTQVEVANRRPSVGIVKPPNAFEDQNVTFSVNNVTTATYPDTDNDKQILKYQWRFGDGSTYLGGNITKSFAQAGTYPVDVYVSDDQGAVGYSSTTFGVVNVVPAPDFIWSPAPGTEDSLILFDASTTYDTPSDINDTQYYWDFGDGHIARYKYLYHTFISSGTFPVTLTVIDNDGARNQTTKLVTIANQNPTSTAFNSSLAIKEGDTGIFGVDVKDTPTDKDLMEYSWSTGGNGSITTNRYTDNWNGNVYSYSTDPDNARTTSATQVSVANTNPYVMIDSINLLGSITLNMAGTPNNTLFMRILRNGEEVDYTCLARNSWCTRPGNNSVTLPMEFDLSQEWAIEVFYGHLNASLVTNTTGVPGVDDIYSNTTDNFVVVGPHQGARGANPAWLTFTFLDGVSFTMFNVFWVWCDDSWVWRIDPRDYLTTSTLTLKGRVLDRGKDAIDVTISYGDENVTVHSDGNSGCVNFTFNIHGSDNWGNYWEQLWAQWWNKYDEFWGDWSDDFEDWWDSWWSENWLLTLLNWWFSFLDRFEGVNWFDIIFGSSPWDDDWYGCWNNDWGSWWDDVWYNASTVCWDDIIIDAVDDDGGQTRLTLTLNSIDGLPKVENLSPQVTINPLPTNIVECGDVTLGAVAVDYYNTWNLTANENLSYVWDFGDGTTIPGSSTISHSWTHAGEYLVQVLVSDGEYNGTALMIVNVENYLPQIITVSGPQNMTEDYIARFSVENNTDDSASDIGSLRFLWDFADGMFATGTAVEHAWARNGYYNITVYAIDNNGAVTSKVHPIVVCETKPCIKGPYSIQVFEGNLVVYNMGFEDSILDQQNITFTWTIDGVNYTSPRLHAVLEAGYHTGTLTIADADKNNDTDEILIFVDNVIPSITIQNHVLCGPPTPLVLVAYAIDDLRAIDGLVFNWTLNGTYTTIDTTILEEGGVSVVTWTPGHSGNYAASASVTDSTGATVETQFVIHVTLDTDMDGVPDELEADMGTGSSGPDSDGDYLSDNYEINYTFTDPADYDTDDDLLWDGVDPIANTGEAYLGTDPRNNDTDGDGLIDGREVFGWNITVQFLNGTEINKTVYSDPLIVDTDNDRLTDYQEYLNHTDPMSWDTNKNNKSDFLESAYANLFDTDRDGISDVKETETGLIVRFANGTSIRVFSNATNNDTDGDGLTDYEEWYPAGDGFITNPARNDTDGDGVLDVAECFVKTQEYGLRKRIEGNTTGYYYFYANFGPHLKNITVTFGATTAANQSADFEAIVNYQGQTVLNNFTVNATYYFNMTDVSDVTSFKANGLWELWITPTGPDAMLDLFKVEAAVQLNPVNPDTDDDQLSDGNETTSTSNGWITDPTMPDTDNDMWSDYEEVMTKGTNPLERDTDGDGIIDPSDVDPLRNVIIGIKVKSATWADAFWRDIDLSNPELDVVTTIDGRAVATPKQTTSGPESQRAIYVYYWGVTDTHGSIWPWQWSYAWIPVTVSSWTIATTATFNNMYYFDIPDDRRTVSIQSQLWHIWQYSDDVGDKVGENTGTYAVGTSGDKNLNFQVYSGANVVNYEISTIGLNKVNTVAIYKNESTFIRNHYQTISQQNLIMLEITGEVPDTHQYFRSGLNVIVIPTEVFQDTKLHEVIELSVNGTTIDTNLLPDCLKDADFSGIDRGSETVARHVESIFNHTVNLDTAMVILQNFILILASNESIAGFLAMRVNATELGIASDVLKLIPWDGSIFASQSDTGPMPRTLLAAIGAFFVSIALLLWGGIVAIFDFFAHLVLLIVQWGMKAVGDAIQNAIKAIELLVKAIVLVFFWLLFIIGLVLTLIGFFAFFGIAYSLGSVLDGDPLNGLSNGEFWVSMVLLGMTIKYEISIEMVHIPWIDLWVPDAHTIISCNNEPIIDMWTGAGNFAHPFEPDNGVAATSQPTGFAKNLGLLGVDSAIKSLSYVSELAQISQDGVDLTENEPYFKRADDLEFTSHTGDYYFTNNDGNDNSKLTFEGIFEIPSWETGDAVAVDLHYGCSERVMIGLGDISLIQSGDYIILNTQTSSYGFWFNLGGGVEPTSLPYIGTTFKVAVATSGYSGPTAAAEALKDALPADLSSQIEAARDFGQINIVYNSWGNIANVYAYNLDGTMNEDIPITESNGYAFTQHMNLQGSFDNADDIFAYDATFGTIYVPDVVGTEFDYVDLEYEYVVYLKSAQFATVIPTDHHLRIYDIAPPILYNASYEVMDNSGTTDAHYKFSVYLADLRGLSPATLPQVQMYDNSLNSNGEPQISLSLDDPNSPPNYVNGVKYSAIMTPVPMGKSYYSIKYLDTFDLINQVQKKPLLIDQVVGWDWESFTSGLSYGFGLLGMMMAIFAIGAVVYKASALYGNLLFLAGLILFVVLALVALILEFSMITEGSYRKQGKSPWSYFLGFMITFIVAGLFLLAFSTLNTEKTSVVIQSISTIMGIAGIILTGILDLPQMDQNRQVNIVLDLITTSVSGVAFFLSLSTFELVTINDINMGNTVEKWAGITCIGLAIVAAIFLGLSASSQYLNPE